jgi:acetone carboxylase gamma subunit
MSHRNVSRCYQAEWLAKQERLSSLPNQNCYICRVAHANALSVGTRKNVSNRFSKSLQNESQNSMVALQSEKDSIQNYIHKMDRGMQWKPNSVVALYNEKIVCKTSFTKWTEVCNIEFTVPRKDWKVLDGREASSKLLDMKMNSSANLIST